MNRRTIPQLSVLSMCLLLAGMAIGQNNATVRGFVYRAADGEPEIFTNVYLDGTTYGTATNNDGYFSISKIPPGDYTLKVSVVGFHPIEEKISLKDGQIITRKLYLKEAVEELKEFTVSADKQEAQTEVKMSEFTLTPKDIDRIPSQGAEKDIVGALQVHPGIITTGDQGGQLYIRGGTPVQNKVLLDGMIIYNPFHSIGLFSVFETDIIRNADIYTGGFNSEYGGRISSIMDITTKDGNKKNLSGSVGMTTFGSRAVIEGPIKKEAEPGANSSSFIFAAKTSYLDKTSEALYGYMDNSTDTNFLFKTWNPPPTSSSLPFSYTDLYAKISLNGSNGSKVNLFGFNFQDRVNYKEVSDLHWDVPPEDTVGPHLPGAVGVGANFLLVPAGNPVLVEGNLAFSRYGISLTEGALPPRTSTIKGFNLGLDFTYFIRSDEIKYGVEFLGFATDFNFFNEVGRYIGQQEYTTEAAGFFKYKLNRGKLVVEPSMRLQYYASLSTFSPEPRLGAKYNLTDNLRIKAAAGMYSQNLISANSDRDVVNLFYGFLSGPDNLQQQFVEKDGSVREIKHKLQKANHAILGFEADLSEHVNMNVEGYYKAFTQLTNLNRNKLFDDTPEFFSKPDIFKKDYIVETGDAYGADFVLKYEHKRIYLWMVYSLGFVNRWDGIIPYVPVFERRHNVNLLSTLTFGKDLNWELSARWNYGSGFPFTQTQGFYEKPDLNSIDVDYINANGNLEVIYTDTINQGRLPNYHRLDVMLQRTFVVSERSTIEARFSVTNLYNRQNIFYFDRVAYKRVDQLPILPSLGVSWQF